jgi:hypothetical protein
MLLAVYQLFRLWRFSKCCASAKMTKRILKTVIIHIVSVLTNKIVATAAVKFLVHGCQL